VDETEIYIGLDQLDKQILNVLMGDSRLSLRQIADKLKHSVSTIQKRYNRLIEAGYITGFRVVLNPEKFENLLTAIIGIKVEGGHLVDLEKDIASEKGVCAVYDVTGTFDAILIVKVKSRVELNKFVKNVLATKYVKESCTFVALNTIKEDFRLEL
jgi:Lrp/AsnC family transcriptional regulator for asnA, asnC and gidA